MLTSGKFVCKFENNISTKHLNIRDIIIPKYCPPPTNNLFNINTPSFVDWFRHPNRMLLLNLIHFSCRSLRWYSLQWLKQKKFLTVTYCQDYCDHLGSPVYHRCELENQWVLLNLGSKCCRQQLDVYCTETDRKIMKSDHFLCKILVRTNNLFISQRCIYFEIEY